MVHNLEPDSVSEPCLRSQRVGVIFLVYGYIVQTKHDNHEPASLYNKHGR